MTRGSSTAMMCPKLPLVRLKFVIGLALVMLYKSRIPVSL